MITVKFDPTLTLPNIEVPISMEPIHDEYQSRQQTKFDGIFAPLVKVNDKTVGSNQIYYMELSLQTTPSLYIDFIDTYGFFATLDAADQNCRVQIQILPQHDDTYKKINLMFIGTSIKIVEDHIIIRGTYDVPKLYDSVMKAYGKISSYALFEQIAKDFQLGFASNVTNTSDERWIYNPNKSVISLMDQEILYSGLGGSDESIQDMHVFEWWIDFRNYLNFVDVYQEYKDIIPDSDPYMQIWCDSKYKDLGSDESEFKPFKILSMFTNNPTMMSHELFMTGYTPKSNTATTDINYEVFCMNDLSRMSTIVMDGDVKNNLLMKYEYGGELFGEYDYLTRKACRDIFSGKIYGNTIEVDMGASLLSLNRGYKVNVYWYDMNNIMTSEIQEYNNDSLNSNIPLPESIIYQDLKYIINKTVSGQYTILGEKIIYDYSTGWSHKYTLGRPAEQIQK